MTTNITIVLKPAMVRIVTLLVVVMAVCACSRKSEPPTTASPGDKLEKVTICQGGVLAILPLVTQGQGYFGKAGLTASIINKGDGKLAFDALMAGECDFAACGEPPLAKNAFTKNDFVILASLSTNENATKIIARSDSGIQTAADLKGTTIGVRRGTLSHFFLDQFLNRHAIKKREVTLRFMEPGDLPDALATGKITAYSGADELVLAGRKKLGDKAIILSEPGLCLNSVYLVARREFAASHPETVKNVLAAMIRAEEYLLKNPDGAREQMQKEKGLSPAELDVILKDQHLHVALQKNMLLSLEDHAQWMIENRMTDSNSIPNFLSIIDSTALMALKPTAVTIGRTSGAAQ